MAESSQVSDLNAIMEAMKHSLDDGLLSRNERQNLSSQYEPLDAEERKLLVRRVFELGRGAVADESATRVIDWIAGQVKLLTREGTDESLASEAHFSPTDHCYRRIGQLLEHAQKTVDICVFTITDDRISEQILLAHGRGVEVRIITDNEKAEDLGSDIARLRSAGIPTVVDRTEFHMHHKFAIFDRKLLLTGSYNWTRGAAESNEENFIVTPDPGLIGSFGRTFERLWSRLSVD